MTGNALSTATAVAVLFAAGALAACGGAVGGGGPASAPSAPSAPPAPSAASAASTSATCSHAVPAACGASPPAYTSEVLPILEKRCFGCHTGDGVAADEHDFSKIAGLRSEHLAIVDEVSTCAMPPRARIDDGEAETLLRWVACGQKAD